jgi:hypothetical protein
MYNLAMQPLAFGAVATLPFLHLGETHLRSLAAVTRLPGRWLAYAARQIRHHHGLLDERRARTLALVDLLPGRAFLVPADALQTAAVEGLNRLPVICRDNEQALWLVANGGHLGLSPMYGKTLPEFQGLSSAEAAARYPAAHALSRRLITLPTHARIDVTVRRHLRELFLGAR